MRFKPSGAGKGDGYRPVDKQKYDDHWDEIFGKKGNKKKHEEKTDDQQSK